MKDKIIEILKNVYDPEMPLIDIWTLWLVYDINIDWNKIKILMTLTTPNCPMPGMIVDMVKNAILDHFPDFEIQIDLTFDPLWNPDMIKDESLKQLFE